MGPRLGNAPHVQKDLEGIWAKSVVAVKVGSLPDPGGNGFRGPRDGKTVQQSLWHPNAGEL